MCEIDESWTQGTNYFFGKKGGKMTKEGNKNPCKIWLTASGAGGSGAKIPKRAQGATQQRKGHRHPQESAMRRRDAACPQCVPQT